MTDETEKPAAPTSKPPPKDPPPKDPPSRNDDRQDRLAARLRENLRKRKEQARQREKPATEAE